ncbi:hypothetical protein FRACYDRAFT_247370 [Fragilariopsis cylindrus CCMP1102]|uniref:Uncharacterized protein n=1 Tax=Fragilariopsis cylindrus CCMP1102 TaxID=635003 RepID=A0A1E7EWR6_9STRA|nr:hypothetical protein FRACYDRAFT_247370 [Fragilariopsis cylindrus CCMP1102]|eukprot:OEU10342.1 hypothetical protein FRACYDRAFT_247370 [Fragilariopsis cylindrus CCMP1102]
MSSDSNPTLSRQCYHKRRKTDKTRLANFLSDHELLVDSTHPEAYLNILKQKRDEINEKWLDNYYTDPTTKVFAGGNEKTPEHHWRCEMAKLNQMIVESERTLAETEDVPELIPDQAESSSTLNNTDSLALPGSSVASDSSAATVSESGPTLEQQQQQIEELMSPSATSLLVMDLGEASSEINSRIMAGDTCFTIGSHSLLLIKMLANLVNQSNNQTKHSNRLPENTQGQVSTFLCNLFDKLQTSECITDLSLDNIKVAKGFIEKCIKTSPNSRKRHFSNRKSSNSHSRNPNKRPCLDNFKTPKRQDGGSVWQTIDNLEGKLASEKRYSTKLEGKVPSFGGSK